MKLSRRAHASSPTPEKLFEKIALDPRFFIETFFHIVDKNRASVPFIFNKPQLKLVAKHPHPYRLSKNGDVVLAAPAFDLVLKARKQGFSSAIEAVWLHACLFVKNSRCVVMSHEKEATKRHLEKVRYYLRTLGDEDKNKFVVELDDDSQMQLSFPETGSTYWIGTAGAKAFGRGDDITHLHISEPAHYEHQDVLTGVLEACVPNAWRIMETTGNGLELFYRLWQEASAPNSTSPWTPIFCAWHEDPEYSDPPSPKGEPPLDKHERSLQLRFSLTDSQIFWKRHKLASMVDPSLFPQEYPAEPREAFLAGGTCVFDADGLAAQELKVEEPSWQGRLVDKGDFVDFELEDKGPLLIYRQPTPSSKYFIFADPSYGKTSGDWSPAVVLRYGSLELCALLWAKLDPTALGSALYGLGMYYNWAKVAVEVFPGPGIATVSKLVELLYPSLYKRWVWQDNNYKESVEYGWVTDAKSRHEMITAGKTFIREKLGIIRSRPVLDQFYNFVRHEGGREEARSGTHDDAVMALCGAVRCMQFDPVGELLDPDQRSSASSKMIQVTGGLPQKKARGLLRSRQYSHAETL